MSVPGESRIPDLPESSVQVSGDPEASRDVEDMGDVLSAADPHGDEENDDWIKYVFFLMRAVRLIGSHLSQL